MTYTLVLLRHGESVWNKENLFTGWHDPDLTVLGREQARQAGRDLAAAGVTPEVLHTSLLTRAIRTAQMALDEMGLLWLPVRRSWRLNERHYGALESLDKKATSDKYGLDQVKIWRRSYDVPPPPLELDDERHPRFDARYAGLPPDLLPASECLKDVVSRMLPYWYDDLVPDLAAGRTVLVAAHGNSLRALVMHLDGISEQDIPGLNLPTGVPIRYELGEDFMPLEHKSADELPDRYLGDVEAAKAAAEAVARQAG
ncbi:MAG: 2,3-diphosphoglycerate-dependent phosphoglycerate mutase [Acidimicrobiales bacterium]|jgi:2,3-bisphosphoglycerate-dependent phosphoglycerate mutase|nr:2,3-diphosphoglycerate-dependent phosphoglycerate mutase [Acidimicrobiales bacterium]